LDGMASFTYHGFEVFARFKRPRGTAALSAKADLSWLFLVEDEEYSYIVRIPAQTWTKAKEQAMAISVAGATNLCVGVDDKLPTPTAVTKPVVKRKKPVKPSKVKKKTKSRR